MSDIHVLSDTIDTDADCRLTSTDSVTVCQSYGTCTYTVRALYRYRYNVMYNINVMTNVVQCHDVDIVHVQCHYYVIICIKILYM